MQVKAPHTDQEYAEYLKTAKDGTCVVCGSQLYCAWTDLHGQGRCQTCGVSYGLIPTYPNDKLLARLNVAKNDVKLPYCDLYEVVPLYRAYWQETGRKIHAGRYMGNGPDRTEDIEFFIKWMQTNAPKLRPLYESYWDWDWFENPTEE